MAVDNKLVIDKNKLQEACSSRFYKIVLGWDYFRLPDQSNPKKKKSKKVGDGAVLEQVKDTYKDVDDYLATFEPLLFEEVKAQIVQQDDSEEVTGWKDAVIAECSEADEFHYPAVLYESEERYASQNDLLLVSKDKFQEGKIPSDYAFGLVEHRRESLLRLRLYLAGEVEGMNVDKVEPCQRLLNMRSTITEVGKLVYIRKISSLSTIFREYIAMRSIGSLSFKHLLLTAAENNSASQDQAWKIPQPLMEYFKATHNESQLTAIHACLSRKPFVLIQGPPGTGKTQTILGLLSAILHASPGRVQSKGGLIGKKRTELSMEDRYHHWEQASPWLTGINPRDKDIPIDGDDGFFPTTGNDMKPEIVNSSRRYRVRVLVCAPSNSALDEIVVRVLSTGIRDEFDRAYNPKIVRFGLNAHHSVQSVTLDNLVKKKLASMDCLGTDKQKRGASGKDADSLRASVLDEAAIVFSTLSFSGSFSNLTRGFDVVIIDEAAQAVEPATLIPLSYGCKQVFLVGDPKQLPATVISDVATKFGYNTSLFKRFQRAGYPVQMLKTQYRMHPEIRSFPSREFYDDALEDGPDIKERTQRDWHKYRCFGPFCFFDIHEGRESRPEGATSSWVNVDEVDFIIALYHNLITRYPDLKSSRLAIITPYKGQVKLLRERFKEAFGVDSSEVVDINTVDGFQGREKDLAIFSCVRAKEVKESSSEEGKVKSSNIGFVKDARRMNVGITRARSSVLVVGSSATFKNGDEHWKNLIESAETRNCFFQVSKPYTSFFNEERLKTMKVESEGPMAMMEEDDIEYNIPGYGHAGDGDQEMGVDGMDDGDGDGDGDVGGDGDD